MRSPKAAEKCTRTPCVCDPLNQPNARDLVLKNHAADRKWTEDELESAFANHALMQWGATEAMTKSAIRVRCYSSFTCMQS